VIKYLVWNSIIVIYSTSLLAWWLAMLIIIIIIIIHVVELLCMLLCFFPYRLLLLLVVADWLFSASRYMGDSVISHLLFALTDIEFSYNFRSQGNKIFI
jgi:hypothetical protein